MAAGGKHRIIIPFAIPIRRAENVFADMGCTKYALYVYKRKEA